MPAGQTTISPRVKNAILLYATGSVRTKAEAAVMAGVHEAYFNIVTSPANGHPEALRLMSEIQQMILDQGVRTSDILEKLGRKALGALDHLMDNSKNEAIILKAASDLADRAPSTSRVQKHQIEGGMSIATVDAQALAAAIVRGAEIKKQYAPEVQTNFVRIQEDHPDEIGTDSAAPEVHALGAGGTPRLALIRAEAEGPDGTASQQHAAEGNGAERKVI